MKFVVAILGGLVLTLAVFAGGAFTAVSFLSAEPASEQPTNQDTAGIWAIEPVHVDPDVQSYERLPPRLPEDDSAIATALNDDPRRVEVEEVIDFTATGSISADQASDSNHVADRDLIEGHIVWCSDRYRSYRVEDNSYQPYQGERQDCLSPYMEAVVASDEAGRLANDENVERSVLISSYAGEATGNASSDDHVRYCLDRYRSYRVEDNTYQPYGGGPRRQCE